MGRKRGWVPAFARTGEGVVCVGGGIVLNYPERNLLDIPIEGGG